MKIKELICLDCFEEGDGNGSPVFDINGEWFNKELENENGYKLSHHEIKQALLTCSDMGQCKSHEDYSKLRAVFDDGTIIDYNQCEILEYMINN